LSFLRLFLDTSLHDNRASFPSLFKTFGGHFMHWNKEFPLFEAGPRYLKKVSQTNIRDVIFCCTIDYNDRL
jgi:hypothetical protein